MEKFAVIFLTLMLFAAVAVAVPLRRDLLKRNKELKESLDRFPCQAPQERFISLNELVPQKKTTQTYFPTGAVLYRCDQQSGWCRNNNCECGPKTIEEVELVFHIEDIEDKSRMPYEIVKAENHTECACLTRQDIPK